LSIIDAVIILLILLGAVIGFKQGFIKKTTSFLGLFIVVILAFIFKNPLSVLMYENLPFFSFGGFIKGVEVINILLYELIAFLVVFIVLIFALRVLILVSGLIEKLLKMTIFLSIPSKILGIVVGAIEAYVYIFLVLVILSLPVFKLSMINESRIADFMLNSTPIISNLSSSMVDTYANVYNIVTDDTKTNIEMNEEILKMMIDTEVITKDSAKKLVEMNKITINDKSILQ